jgi:Zn-finger nucleic acid-binding protein
MSGEKEVFPKLVCPRCRGNISVKHVREIIIKCTSCNTSWKDGEELYREFMQIITGISRKTQRPIPLNKAQGTKRRIRSINALILVKSLPLKASLKILLNELDNILKEIRLAPIEGKPYIYKAIEVLREQPHIIKAMIEKYEALQDKEFVRRLQVIRVIGGLRRQDALPFLKKILSKPLPSIKRESTDRSDRILQSTRRQNEEIIMMKAVHGIGYLGTEEAYEVLIDLMCNHESNSVQITAIDTYMWNHNDSELAAERLYNTLTPEFHKHIRKPRFHRNMNVNEFNQQLTSWIEKWGEE